MDSNTNTTTQMDETTKTEEVNVTEVKRRQKQVPTTLVEAKTLYANKFLFNVNKLDDGSKDYHVKLVCLILTRLLRREYEHHDQVHQHSGFDIFKEYCNNVGMQAYQDNESVKKLIKNTLGENVKDECLVRYFKIVFAFVEMLNLNILNCSVYVDSNKFGRNKLVPLIETVVFTQLLPTELSDKDLEFKQSLRKSIDEFKETLKQPAKAQENTVKSE